MGATLLIWCGCQKANFHTGLQVDTEDAASSCAKVIEAGRPVGVGSLLSHLGGPQPQGHLGIGRILFSTVKEIGQGFALEHVQLHQA